MKRVLLADGHSAVRFGLNQLIGATEDIVVVGESDHGDEALCLVDELKPDLVVLGLNLRVGKTGIEACREMKSLAHPPRVMVYVAYDFAENIAFCLLREADSYVHKGIDCLDLLDALRCTVAGERVWRLSCDSIDAAFPLNNASGNIRLTAKEREVLVLMLCGCSNAEISRELYVAIPTVRTHVKSILRKLGAGCRRDLLRSPTSLVSNF